MAKSIRELNLKAVSIVKTIKLLDAISWPKKIEEEFFTLKKSSSLSKLRFEYPSKDYSEQKSELKKIVDQLSKDDPLHIYTKNSIESYMMAMQLVESRGSKSFQDLSIQMYGLPKHKLFGSNYSHLETAKTFLKSFEDFDHPFLETNKTYYSANLFKKFLMEEAPKTLGSDTPKVKISKEMTAKAAAGKTFVKIRKNAKFTNTDFKQLLIHEVYTHTLTALNGQNQYHLPLMAQGAPRTTKTQEGLATFSEVINGLLDLDRLKRLSLRIIAIEKALDGADLYDLYKFFQDNQQSEQESYLSASRILRGGFPTGGIVFTKDAVYLEGLIRVHSFFRWAFKTKNLDLIHMLFCGRLDLNDIFLLKDCYHLGLINQPKYLPDWYKNTDLLAGKMAFSLILNTIDLTQVEDFYNSKLGRFAA